jgi:hypothetical protein
MKGKAYTATVGNDFDFGSLTSGASTPGFESKWRGTGV